MQADLFLAFFKIGIFSFGGGYAMLPMIFHEVVEKNMWISSEAFADMLAISQVTPGPIAINSATYIGFLRTGSVLGSFLTTLGVSLPSFIIMILLSKFVSLNKNKYMTYALRGLRYVTVGLILMAGVQLLNGENFSDVFSFVVFVSSLLLLIYKKIDPIVLILLFAVIGNFVYAIFDI